MRNISAASLAKLSQKTGTEPMILVSISWLVGHNPIIYAEKSLPEYNIEGRIVASGNIDDITNVSQNGTSQSFTITLDDSDGVLKSYLDNIDFHRRPVTVYQWFDGLPLSDTFLLFYGLISTPIIWKEYDRTLSFSVLSKTEGLEVGFAPEQGSFSYVPMNIVGKMWPLVFGYVMKSPTLLIDTIPTNTKQNKGSGATSVTKDPTGIEDPTLQLQITKMTNEMHLAGELAAAYFKNYLYASNTARTHGEIGEFDFVNQGQGTFSRMAQQFQDEGNKMIATQSTLKKKILELQKKLNLQKKNKKTQIGITNGEKYPQNQPLSITLNGAVYEGYFVNQTFNITKATHPNAALYEDFQLPSPTITQPAQTEPILNRDTFFWADASTQVGSPFKINKDPNSNSPIRYIVSGGMQVAVYAVYAYRTVNSLRQLYPVPGNYFSVIGTFFGILPVTLIQLKKALSAYTDDKGNSDGWEDELYATCQSFTSSNTILQMIYIINNFTDMSYDATSFFNVAAHIGAFPSNFTLTNQKDAIKLLQEMAYQARCMLYVKNNTFHIIYLSSEPAPVDTITEADIIHETLEVITTDTEDLATRFIAKWRPDYLPGDAYEIIYRFNLTRYQLITKTIDFFIYNYQYVVSLNATFLMIRETNVFKKITFKTPINKLNIETLDFVTLNFSHPYLCNGPIIGRVDSAIFNPNDYTITFVIWVPVLIGTHEKYIYTYPDDISITASFPTPADIANGRVQPSSVTLPTNQALPDSVKAAMSGDIGEVPALQTPGIMTWGGPLTNFVQLPPIPPVSPAVDSTDIQQVGRPDGVDKYQYDRGKGIVTKSFDPTLAVIPAKTTKKNEDGTYDCDLYYQGLDNKTTEQKKIRRLDPSLADIPDKTFIFVVRFIWLDENKTLNFDFYIQEGSGSNNLFPAQVESKTGDDKYTCTVYKKGIDNPGDTVENVQQMQIDKDEVIPQGTKTFVAKFTWFDEGTNENKTQYYMQIPVWLSDPEDE